MKKKLIYGVGINDYNNKISIDGKLIKSYQTWHNMITRCYSDKYKSMYPTYSNVKICEEWLLFSKFKEWFDKNYPYHLEEQGIKLHLDKDILSGDNKIYSPDTCCFIPDIVNKFLLNKQRRNTSGYIGSSYCKRDKEWVAHINEFNNGKRRRIGGFDTAKEAGEAYSIARKAEVVKVKEYLKNLNYDNKIIERIW